MFEYEEIYVCDNLKCEGIERDDDGKVRLISCHMKENERKKI